MHAVDIYSVQIHSGRSLDTLIVWIVCIFAGDGRQGGGLVGGRVDNSAAGQREADIPHNDVAVGFGGK